MADARYVIDLILDAKDQTSTAVNKALANLGLLDARTRKSAEEAEKFGQRYERAMQGVDRSSVSLDRTSEALHRVGDEYGVTSRKSLEAIEQLDAATRKHVRSVDEYGAAHTKTKLALHEVLDAQKALTEAEDDALAMRVRLTVAEEEHAKVVVEVADKTASAEEESVNRRIAAREKLNAILDEATDDFQKRIDANSREADEFVKSQERKTESARKAAVERAADEAQLQESLGELEQRRADSEEARRVEQFENEQRRRQQRLAQEEALQNALRGMEERADAEREDRYEREARRREQDAEAARQQREQDLKAEEELAALREHLGQREAEQQAERNRQEYQDREDSYAHQQEQARQAVLDAQREDHDRRTREREYQSLLGQTARARADAAKGRQLGATPHVQATLDARTAEFEAKIAVVAEQIRRLDNKTINVKADLDTAKFLAGSANMRREVRQVESEGSGLQRFFGVLSSGFSGVGGNANGSGRSIASFDNSIRGMLTLGVTVFFQQLLQVGGALVGMLIALASSAVQAGAALGGALAGGAAQALPVIGVLATAFMRVKGVLDAVKQANLLQQQQSYQAAKANDTQANAADGLVSAQEALANAHRGVQQAQENVTKARRDAVRQLQDLILAERDAKLAAEGASLSQRDAQRALRAAIASGGDVERAQLNVKQADLGADQASQRVVSSGQALQEGAVPEQTDAVRKAKEGLLDAQRASADAERGLARAQRTAVTADANITAAAGKLAYLKSQMSVAELALFNALIRLQDRFHKFGKEISQPIIAELAVLADRATALLGDPRIIGAAKGLSSGIAKAMGTLADSFTGEKTIGQIVALAKDARTNLDPLAKAAANFGHAFIEIARLASPTLHNLVEDVKKVSVRFRDFTESASGRNALRKYFQEGLTAVREWAGLLFNIGRLFFAISGAGGAATGTKAVSDLSDAIGRAADRINKAGSTARKFWQDFFKISREVVDALGPIFASISNQLRLTFQDHAVGSVKGFATIIADVVIPALGHFVRVIGSMVSAIGNFTSQHPAITKAVSAMLGIGLIFGFLFKVGQIFEPLVKVVKLIVGVGKELGIFGKIGKEVAFHIQYFGLRVGEVVSKIGPLSRLIETLVSRFSFLADAMLGPWGLVVIAVALLLAKLGLLDDLGRAIGGFFTSMWAQIRPPVDRLVKSFGHLVDAVKEGKGAFGLLKGAGGLLMDVLKPILKIVIDIIGVFLSSFGSAIGKVIGGVIDVLSGFIDVVVGLLSGDWRMAWNGLKRIVEGAGRAVIGVVQVLFLKGVGKVFGGLGRLLGGILKDVGEGLLGAFRGIGARLVSNTPRFFSGILDFFKALPSRIFGFIKELADRAPDKFKTVGKAIVTGLIGGLSAMAGELGKALRGLIGGLPGGKIILGAIDKVEGTVKGVIGGITKHFATGGPVPGSGSGDTVPAMLTPGEHVLTKGEVAAAGGHGVIFALRRMLGGGGQGGPRGYAPGGTVYSGNNDFALRPVPQNSSANNDVGLPTAAEVAASKQLTAQRAADAKAARQAEAQERQKELTTTREDYQKSNTERANNWRVMWNDMLVTARRASNDIQTQVREMRVGIAATLDRLASKTQKQLFDIAQEFSDTGQDVANAWASVFNAVQNVTFDGLNWIGTQTNKVLKALGADTIALSVSKPTSKTGGADVSTDHTAGGRYAQGGVVGQWGERGRDGIHAVLGRGEAVLNWAQQKAVNAAMGGRDTLASIFSRTNAYHAGGPGPAFAFASGGGDIFDGHPSNVNSAVKSLIELMKKHFPLVVSSTTDHSRLTTSGNVSDHTTGAAVDLAGSPSVMLRAANFVKSSGLYRKIKQGIHNPNLAINAGKIQAPPGQFGGAVWAQHANHIHLAIVDALNGAYADAASTVGKLTVNGSGALKNLSQTVLSKVRAAANRYIGQQGGFGADANDEGPAIGQGAAGREIFRFFRRSGFTDQQAAAFVGNFVQESGLNPAAVQPNGEGHGLGQWGGGRFAALQTFAAARHTKWQDLQTQLDFVLHELHGSEGAAYAAIKAARSLDEAVNAVGVRYERYGIQGDRSGPAREALKAYGGEFADGGEVPGGRGKPIVITAHAGEWVLNPLQQSKLARALGTGVGKVRDFLGFSGGPTSFAGGGAPKGSLYEAPDIEPMTTSGIRGQMTKALAAIRKLGSGRMLGKSLDNLIANVEAFTEDTSGLFLQLNAAIETRTSRMATTVALAQAGFRRVGNKLRAMVPLVDPEAIAGRELANLERTGGDLESGRRQAAGRLRDVQHQINQTPRSKRKGADYQALITARNALTKSLDDFDAKLSQNYTDRFAKASEQFDAGTDAALAKIAARQSKTSLASKIGSTLGRVGKTVIGTETINVGTPQDIANQALKESRDQQKVLRARYNQALRKSKTDPRWKATADKLLEELNSATGDIADNLHASIQAGIDAVTKNFDDLQSDIDIRRRVATATGNRAALPGLSAEELQNAKDHITSLEGQARIAKGKGDFTALADITKQLTDLHTQVTEKSAQIITDAVQAAEDEFNRVNARLDVRTRRLDLSERVRGATAKVENFTDREQISTDRLAAIEANRVQVRNQIADATAQGFTGIVETLTDTLKGLDETYDEETQTRQEFVYQYRQAAVDLITGATTRSTGLVGTAQSIFEKINALTGTSNTDDARRFARQQKDILQGAAGGISDQIGQSVFAGEFGGDGTGILASLRNAFSSGDPGSFANTLAGLGPNIAALENTMGDAQRTSFQALIQAMIDNTTATLDNNKTIADLDGTLSGPQSFASSSWSWFRNAMFSGMGDVLPQYAIPHMATGGGITKGGIFELHPGEFVVNAKGSNVPDSGDINITMNSVDGNVDLTALAARIAFAKKSRS